MNLQLSLIKKWFDMTKAGIKTEDYREITPYWCARLLLFDGEKKSLKWWKQWFDLCFNKVANERCFPGRVRAIIKNKVAFCNNYDVNIMTLGYPKASDSERILKLKHEGIEIREGNPEWGAEPGQLYFVIKHGEVI